MGTIPTPKQADVQFRELSFEIQTLAQQYINEGRGNEDMRNAIRGILALAAGLVNVLQQALQQ
jgi:hypothetical protein